MDPCYIFVSGDGPEKRRESRLKSGKRQPVVFVVDDFVDNRQMYAEYLAFVGYAVVECVNGEEALTKAATEQPDLIVMDLSLPVMDGWEATRRLKSDPQMAAIPVLALTSHALDDSRTTALAAGADAFLVKPCLPEELAAKVNELLNGNPL